MSDDPIVIATADSLSAFDAARGRAIASVDRSGIGTLGEKLVHRTLKLYLEPREEYHEVAVCGYVADVMNESGIIEIQTRGFSQMKDKLARFLDQYSVTLVYPVIVDKEILWFDKHSGELASRRKSSKHATARGLLSELSGIGELALHDRLTLKLVFLRREGAGRVDKLAADGDRLCGVVEDFTLPRGAHSDVFEAPFVHGVLIFSHQSLARAGRVNDDKVKAA